MKYVDLSGYSFTGKAAVIDLMREIRGCAVPSSEFEFALLRCKDGILDLEHALVEDWSPVRSCEAIRCFQNLIRVYGGNGSIWARLTRHGHHYDRAFPGFTARSVGFVDVLVEHSWRGEWPFATYFQHRAEVIARKIAFRLRWRGAAMYPIYLAAPGADRFMSATREYLDDVLSAAAGPEDDLVVTHNAFEPFDPTRAMRFFDDARVIIVDRDPRDVYVSAHRYVGRHGRKGWPSTTAGNVEAFIAQYRTTRSRVKRTHDDGRVLRVMFESLITDYEHSVTEILRFIGKTPADHLHPHRYFDPARSAAGIGSWHDFADQRSISMIEQHLPEFCVSEPSHS
jgi:Sulfotransferase family